MFFSLLAASVDGFICGFIIGGMGVKFRCGNFVRAFGIIFFCCTLSAVAGNLLAQTQLYRYINIIGIALMLWLAHTALCDDLQSADNSNANTDMMALSVATDASAVCLYLAMQGYNIMLIALLSAFMHSVLMAAAAFISDKILKDNWIIFTRYISGIIFLCMALIKIINL